MWIGECDMSISNKDLNKIVRKLRVTNNSVLMVRESSALATKDTISDMAKMFEQIGLKNVVVVVVDEFNHLETVSETEMNKLGWFKIEALRKIVNRKSEEVPQEG
jgi:hypothetical protein